MPSPSPHVLLSPMYLRLIEAFNKPADDAGILQGVRKFRSGLPHVRVVLSASPKNGGKFIPCEGRLEAAFAQALEVDPEVAAYRTQPFSFPGPNGRPLVCDFAVKWVNYTYSVVDIKPKGQLDRPSVKDRMAYVRSAMAAAQIPHRVVTEADLEGTPASCIRRQLRKAAGVLLPPGGREKLLPLVSGAALTLGALRSKAVEAGFPPLAPEYLMLQGDIIFPLGKSLHETTLIGVFHGTDSSSTHGWGSVRDVRLPL